MNDFADLSQPAWPAQLADYRRFDIPAKTFYAALKRRNISSPFADELYAEHLRVWNGFHERLPEKYGLGAYRYAFDGIVTAIGDDRFDFEKSPVKVAPSGQLFDGSHRVSAAWAHGKQVCIVPAGHDPFDTYDFAFFLKRTNHVATGLARLYADAMALEYLRLRRGMLNVAVFWPAADHLHDESGAILRDYAEIFYFKPVPLEPARRRNVVRQIYAYEPWVSREEDVDAKADPCFAQGGDLRIYLLENLQQDRIVECKARLRALYGIGKHSVHISDTAAETATAAGMFFNENSIDLLRRGGSGMVQPNFERLLQEFASRAASSGADLSSICLSGSATLAAYGVRDVRDFDFIHLADVDALSVTGPQCSSHNAYWGSFGLDPQEVVLDPRNHFHFRGIKFVAMHIWVDFMTRRGEAKDQRDLAALHHLGLLPGRGAH